MRNLCIPFMTVNILVLVYFAIYSKMIGIYLRKRIPVKTTVFTQVSEVDDEMLKTLQNLFANNERDEVRFEFGNRTDSLIEDMETLFLERVSTYDRMIFRKMLKRFSECLPSNITYFLYAGSLVGSYRHHGMIPWDDDVDVIVRANDKPELLKHLKSLKPKYNYYLYRGLWKLFPSDSQKISPYPWKWPFLDILFYSENRTHIITKSKSRHVFSKTDIFPLISRPFMNMLLPAPKNTSAFLKQFRNISTCCNKIYDHKRERVLKFESVCVSCHDLAHMFPFVNRKFQEATTIEILEGDHVDFFHKKVIHLQKGQEVAQKRHEGTRSSPATSLIISRRNKK